MKWRKKVAEHDFDAALNYLTLKFNKTKASRYVDKMRVTETTQRRANDILRACGLQPLPESDPGVIHTLNKIHDGEKLSPVLLVSFDVGGDIADGYHRVSTAYHADPFMEVPCCLVDGTC